MKILFAAGGTGGHVFPALAIAKAIQHLHPSADVLFVGTDRGFEKTLVPQAGYKITFLQVAGLKGKGLMDRLKGVALLPKAFLQSWKILSRYQPDAVFGIGGYTSGPILLLAKFRKIRTGILEPNSKSGMSNRILAKFVDRIYVAFQESIVDFPTSKCVFTGNPIRLDILSVPPPNFDGEKKCILIFGGSQGAKRLNDAMVSALPDLVPYKSQLSFIHQTGSLDELKTREMYRNFGFEADVFPFQDDMATLYRKSHIIVARSGSSVVEMAACGRPSILIPYPFAADDHQRTNARVMEKNGAAIYLEDAECTGHKLAALIVELIKNKDRLVSMSKSALSLRKDDASEKIALDLVGRGA